MKSRSLMLNALDHTIFQWQAPNSSVNLVDYCNASYLPVTPPVSNLGYLSSSSVHQIAKQLRSAVFSTGPARAQHWAGSGSAREFGLDSGYCCATRKGQQMHCRRHYGGQSGPRQISVRPCHPPAPTPRLFSFFQSLRCSFQLMTRALLRFSISPQEIFAATQSCYSLADLDPTL